MGNDGGLLRIISHLALVVCDRTRKCRHRDLLHRLRSAGHARHDARDTVRREGADSEDKGSTQNGAGNSHAQCAQAGTILTAHFLKSVCLDIGSVASSVVLLMSWLASNHGTNTTPRGIRLRPRTSTRVRISPRRETILTSAP